MKNISLKKSFGLIAASPSEFMVHQRFGKIRHLGRGASATVLPVLDRYWLVPSSVQSIAFCADQITAENQGIEISGFALWSIEKPERIIQAVDFSDSGAAVEMIGQHLRGVVESTIRHQIANLSLEGALRQRATIIANLKSEVAEVADSWGIQIATIEIKNVQIMSKQLFENLQATFRNSIRLEAAKSEMGTNEAIAKDTAAFMEKQAQRETEFKKAQSQREEGMRREQIASETGLAKFQSEQQAEIRLTELQSQVIIQKGKEESQRAVVDSVCRVIEMEKQVAGVKFEADRTAKENAATLAEMDNAMELEKIETANNRSLPLLLAEGLPKMLDDISIGEVNLGDPVLAKAIGSLLNGLGSQKKAMRGHGNTE